MSDEQGLERPSIENALVWLLFLIVALIVLGAIGVALFHSFSASAAIVQGANSASE